ncbi:hypothetical protein Esti_005345 [Eimeria stiedai]
MALGAQQSSLLKLLDFSQCECRNEATADSLLSLLKSVAEGKGPHTDQEGAPLLASAHEDPQLFISLGFSVPVRLTGLRIAAPRGAQAAGEAPRRLRLFFNDPTKSFTDAGKLVCLQALPDDASIEEGVSLPLRSVRYKGVASLQIFVAENGGADATKISLLDIQGTPADNLQMKDWKPVKPEEALAVNDT